MRKIPTRKIVACALVSALALISFIIENLFPPLFIPGAKLGISNVFILFATFALGYGYGITAFVIKVTLGSVFSGNVSALIYSFPSGLIALTVEILLWHFLGKKLSILAISTCGSVINVLLQNATFCIVTKSTLYFSFAPYLTLIAFASGLAVGFAVFLLLKFIPYSLYGDNCVNKENVRFNEQER